ncbi:MAG: FAD-binding oxidoreductase [Vicinamibacterales bacterium]
MLLTLPIREVLPATPRARIVRLDLEGRSLCYEPGQALAIATHGIEPRRPYSIASSPEETARTGVIELLIGVGANGEPGSHLQLTVGTRVDVEGPIGGFTFVDRHTVAKPGLLFVAGGTGIAPLRSMLQHALALGFQDIGVLYSARTPDDLAYEGELRTLQAQGRIDLQLTVTRQAAPTWSGTRGRIDAGLLRRLLRGRETFCYVCGPRPLVEEMPKALADLGVPADHIRIEEW